MKSLQSPFGKIRALSLGLPVATFALKFRSRLARAVVLCVASFAILLVRSIAFSLGIVTAVVASISVFSISSAQAATVYWDTAASANWSDVTKWSTASGATTPDPSSVPAIGDDVVFNITGVNGAETISLNGNQAANTLTFNNTGATIIQSTVADQTLTLASGITVSTGAGLVTIGSATAANRTNVILGTAGVNQAWTLNGATNMTVTNGVAGTASSGNTQALTINGSSTGALTFSGNTTAITDGANGGRLALVVNGTAFGGGTAGLGVNLSSANSYTGGTTITQGRVNAGNVLSFGAANSLVTVQGTGDGGAGGQAWLGTAGTWLYDFNISGFGNNETGNNGQKYAMRITSGSTIGASTNTFTIANAAAIGTNGTGSFTIDSKITGTGALTIREGGATGQTTTATLTNANNDYSGTTTLTRAILQLNASTAAQNSIIDTGAGTTNVLKFGNGITAATIGGLAGTGAGAVSLLNNVSGAVALTVGNNNNTGMSYSGVISGAGASLIKIGTGIQTLSGANTYTGATSVSAGTLTLTGSLGTNGGTGSSVSTSGSGTFTESAAGVINGTGVTFTQGSSGISTLAGTNTYTGGTTISAGTLTAAPGAANATNLGSGAVTIGGSGTLRIAPTASGSLSMGAGALNINAGATIGNNLSTAITNGGLITTGAATVGANYKVAVYGTGAAVVGGSQTLVTAGSGLDTITPTLLAYNATNFTLGAVSISPTSVSTTVTSQTALTSEFWNGGFSGGNSVWAISDGSTSSNWVSDLAGTATSLTPGATATVTFSDTTPANNAASTTLGSNMSILGMVVNDTNGVGLNADGNTLTIGTGGITVNNTGGNPSVTIGASVALGGNQTWTNNSTNALTVSGVISGSGTLAKAGTGALTLSGANTYTGATTVSAGTLNYNGSLAAGAQINVGVAGGGNAVMNLQAGSSITLNPNGTNNIVVGAGTTSTTGQGFLYQSGGAIVGSTGTTPYTQFSIGNGASGSSYGYYNLSGGTASVSEIDIGGFNGAATGVLDMSGGTLTTGANNGWLIVSRSQTSGGGIGILNMTGGTLNYTGVAGHFLNNWGTTGTGTAVINVANATLTAANADVSLNAGTNGTNGSASNFGEINLLTGGTLQAHSITGGSAAGTKMVNFNGGTLKASTASATFLNTNLSAVNVFGNGGTIDNNGVAITIPVALVAASGSGVSTVAVTSGGSGYLGAPAVTFSGGGGTGAAGYATLSGGVITGIVITNPGTGYTSAPAITLTGGGSTNATIGTITTAANTSGGMTFTGTGTTTLTGANTYNGTTVNAGTVTVGTNGTLGATTGALAVNNANTGAGTNVVLNLATAADTITGSFSGTLATPGSGTNTATINTQTGRNFTVNQTTAGTYAGIIAGAGNFTLGSLSTNTLTLTGINTYTGTTTVSQGELVVSGSLSGTTDVTVAAPATLASGITGSITTATTGSVSVSGSLAPGRVGTIGTLTLAPGNTGGKLSFASGSTFKFDIDGATSDLVAFSTPGDWLTGNNNVTLALNGIGSGINYRLTYTVFQNANVDGFTVAGITGYDTVNYSAQFAFDGSNNYQVSFLAVPEPGSAVSLLGGLGMLLGMQRVRRRTRVNA